MTSSNPFIHLFKTPGGHYIYDVNTNTVLNVEKQVYDFLHDSPSLNKSAAAGDSTGMIYPAIENMMKEGYLSYKKVEEILHPESDVLLYRLNNKLGMIILQVTQQCNFRCDYCIYSGSYMNRAHSNRKMDIATAKKGIDFLIAHSMDSHRINVGFYGGEPLLEFDLVKECILYAQEQAQGKTVTFTITTNGTLLNEAIVEFFALHGVALTISLDGPREVHDKNRRFASNGCGSFDKITAALHMIREKYPDYYKSIMFNAVIDPENDLTCTNEFFLGDELIKDSLMSSSVVSNVFRKNESQMNEDFAIKNNYEIFKTYLWKLGRFDSGCVSQIFKQYFQSASLMYDNFRKPVKSVPDRAHPSGPCIPGAQRLFMDVNGDLFPCERVSENSDVMKIGSVTHGFDVDKALEMLNPGKLSEEKCRNCWAFMYCQLCAAYAYTEKGLSGEQKISHCGRMRRIVEDLLKDYCALQEMGYDFEDRDSLILYECGSREVE